MLSFVLIGTGNVATHLFNAFLNVDEVAIKQVFGRNRETLKYFSEHCSITTNIDAIVNADIYLIAVTDDEIASVSEIVSRKPGIVAHTSGSISMASIRSKRKGVFYPLQSFTKNKEIDFTKIPICIEASDEKGLSTLNTFANFLTESVNEISSEKRKKLHLAAVFANNFSNHLFQIAQELCETESLPFELIQPLILETVDKLSVLNPKKAQTGPARRNDVLTMQQHLDELNNPIHKKIYQLLSQSIKETYEKKL
ncbi:Rossmann-like and DUF2520 domain-containing protein [Croceitalea rosinachiae]|uniref:DUF2520 domain-containing protein n=1 Tax=Croceitalea rosinachiae TaxID=3075596 RepID=A0ABU3AAX7_9FLAO|nr:DUF2520 domain-containing protein [Croceitalea sp. F388]MDT0607341.1 DUF2520 domain-containing protein [Croceitalea sp. F388]